MRRALRHFGGRPRLSKLAQVLAKFGFHAPLLGSVIPAKGVGAASFTRTGTAITTVVDHEGAIRNCKVGEARFQRLRRVENLLPGSEFTSTIPAGWTLAAATYSNNTLTATGSGGRVLNSVTPVVVRGTRLVFTAELDAGTVNTASLLIYDATALVTRAQVNLTLTGRKRYALEYTGWVPGNQCTCYIYVKSTSNAANGDTIKVYSAQLEDTTGRVNTNPSEYVSVGAPKANRLIETENFGAAAWLKSAATVAESAVRGPNGERAWETTWNAGGFFYQLADGGTGGSANETCYARVLARAVSTATKVGCRIDRNGVPQGNQQDYAITNSAWTEVLVGPFTLDANTASPALRFDHFDGNVILTRAQLVRGTTLPTYVPVGNVYPFHGACVDGVRYFDYANGNTVVNNVVVEGFGASLPGVFDGTAGFVPEIASTNLCPYSNNFGLGWSTSGTSSRTAAAKYIGDVPLDLVGDTDAATGTVFMQNVNYTGDGDKPVSIVLAPATGAGQHLRIRDNTAVVNRLWATVTWNAGVPSVACSVGSEERPAEALADGAYRFYFRGTGVVAANSNTLYFYPSGGTVSGSIDVAATGTVYAGCVQTSNEPRTTSVVVTQASSILRNGDMLSYPTAGNASLNGLTVFAESRPEVYVSGNIRVLAVTPNQDSNNRVIDLYYPSGTAVGAFTNNAAVAQYSDNVAVGSVTTTRRNKAAATIGPNWAIKSINGALGTPDGAVTMPASMNVVEIGALVGLNQPGGVIRHFRMMSGLLASADLSVACKTA